MNCVLRLARVLRMHAKRGLRGNFLSSITTNPGQTGRKPLDHLDGGYMRFEQSIHEGLKAAERRLAAIRREERKDERERFAYWSSRVLERAESQGRSTPTPADLAMLKRLAEMESPFSAAQVVRSGWCGIRRASDATKTLERFVAAGWIHPALPNREGHARYAFTREYALGDNAPDRLWESIDAWNYLDPEAMLHEAEFLHVDEDADEWSEKPVAECEFCGVPDQTAESDIWAVARKLAFERGTKLHKIADCIEGLTPIQSAYAMAIAKCRVDGDPVKTHLRGIAEYLRVDYNAFCAGVKVAEAAIRILNEIEMRKAVPNESDNPATPMPTIEI